MDRQEYVELISNLVVVCTLKTFTQTEIPQQLETIRQVALLNLTERVKGWEEGEIFCVLACDPEYQPDWNRAVEAALESLQHAQLIESSDKGWVLTERGNHFRAEAQAEVDEKAANHGLDVKPTLH
jgi:hypothetical protein